jgi:hypothetical protein
MPYSLKDKIRMLICKIFGHFPRGHWEYNGKHATCKCCKHVVTERGGKYQ